MSNPIQNLWNRYTHLIYRILSFMVATLIITYLLPKAGQFKYEYEKGRPWRHETLIAPFDFAIYKPVQELKKERDSLMTHFRPYFSMDSLSVGEITRKIEAQLKLKRLYLSNNYPAFYNRDEGESPFVLQIEAHLIKELQTIYQKGVILIPDGKDASDLQELMVIKGNVAEPYGITELYTPRRAYSDLITKTVESFSNVSELRREKIYNLLSDCELHMAIVPNINFQKERTEQELQNVLKNLSVTNGKVLADQRIIGTGDLVDDLTDKKLSSLRKEYESRLVASSGISSIFSGQLMIVALLLTSVYLFLYFFRKDVYDQLQSINFILLMMVLMVFASSITARIAPTAFLVIPFAILPIILRTFFDSRLAFYIHVITILTIGFLASNSFQFAILQIPAGMVAIFTLFKMVRRSQIVRSAFFIALTYMLLYSGLQLWQEGSLTNFNVQPYGQFIFNAVLILLSYPIIYIFERIFGFLSDVTLMELSDTNHPLLRKLAEQAPGTFQHSIQVGNLAQEVAYQIGANPMLVRAGAMYHDIGKIESPMFFTENQINHINPHHQLEFDRSAQIVILHIENGIRLARKNKLPEQIIDFIATHQGTTKARYFYNSYVNANPGIKADERKFTYPGPTPFTKETAILMMADALEASSRSLKNYSSQEIDNLVERIIASQIEEQQFDDAPITFKEIKVAKEVLKAKLKNIYHARIAYPDLDKKQDSTASN